MIQCARGFVLCIIELCKGDIAGKKLVRSNFIAQSVIKYWQRLVTFAWFWVSVKNSDITCDLAESFYTKAKDFFFLNNFCEQQRKQISSLLYLSFIILFGWPRQHHAPRNTNLGN